MASGFANSKCNNCGAVARGAGDDCAHCGSPLGVTEEQRQRQEHELRRRQVEADAEAAAIRAEADAAATIVRAKAESAVLLEQARGTRLVAGAEARRLHEERSLTRKREKREARDAKRIRKEEEKQRRSQSVARSASEVEGDRKRDERRGRLIGAGLLVVIVGYFIATNEWLHTPLKVIAWILLVPGLVVTLFVIGSVYFGNAKDD